MQSVSPPRVIPTKAQPRGGIFALSTLRSSVDIGQRNLAKYFYTNDGNNYLSRLDYGNGDGVQYEYDGLGRVTKETYEDNDTVTYRYDNSGALATVTDSETGRTTTYYYDFTDRLMKYVETGEDYYHSVGYEYDTDNNLTSLVETINGTDYTTSYTYDDDNRLTSMTTGGTTVEYTYDDYGRVTTQVTKRGDTTILTETYTYVAPSDISTSSRIATYKTETANYSVTYTYTYDDNGNILSVHDGTYTTTYVYDSANQLRREDNEELGFTQTWAYDNAGNIRTQAEFSYTTGSLTSTTRTDTVPYTYGNSEWGNLLTAYDGAAITYDEIGNPLSDGTRTYTWEHGRQLSSLRENNLIWSYSYDSNGMRTSRGSREKAYSYRYSGSKLMQMSVDGYTFNFTYDASGTPLTVSLSNNYIYYFVTNIHGDVVGILNPSGVEVARYGYDSWGNVEILYDNDPIASYNPLLYRGYVYDQETELYYLQSRYYDPALGRFINADGLISTGQGLLGNNMFAYCGNNPVNRRDSTGQLWLEISISPDVTVACADTLTSYIEPYSNKANCYAYAMKLENDPRTGKPFQRKPLPGDFSGNGMTFHDLMDELEIVKSNINKKVSADAEKLGLNYTEVSHADYVPKPGNWIVALVYATDGSDIHWYRRDDDGTWSHKRGDGPIVYWDDSGQPITDPATCNRGIYDGFLGYYEVGPN